LELLSPVIGKILAQQRLEIDSTPINHRLFFLLTHPELERFQLPLLPIQVVDSMFS